MSASAQQEYFILATNEPLHSRTMPTSGGESRLGDVTRQGVRRVMLQNVRLGCLSHSHKPCAVIQCASNRQSELAGFNIVVHGVFSIDERLMAFDRLPADERHRPGKCRLVRTETVPTVALRRPDKPCAGTAS